MQKHKQKQKNKKTGNISVLEMPSVKKSVPNTGRKCLILVQYLFFTYDYDYDNNYPLEQNDRKQYNNNYPLEQNENKSENENGCQILFLMVINDDVGHPYI